MAEFNSYPLTSLDTFLTASISRPSSDISYVLIGGPHGEDSYPGVRPDNLRFADASTPVPATVAGWLLLSGLGGLGFMGRRRKAA